MVAVTTFYIDDSGTRHPDHKPKLADHKHDWFALGGILIDDEDIPDAESRVAEFRHRWPQMSDAPLHSCEIRGRHDNFAWLGVGDGTFSKFLTDLESLLLGLPVLGLACVMDRPGYNRRYLEQYKQQRWRLCKTAFAVATERAVKYAMKRGRKVRIYVERTDKATDKIMAEYYVALRTDGHWFNPGSAEKYDPVSREQYQQTLYEFRTKAKTSPLMQIADLYLWPMCIGGYDRGNGPYSKLIQAGKLIDCSVRAEEVATLGIKYSCFDGATVAPICA